MWATVEVQDSFFTKNALQVSSDEDDEERPDEPPKETPEELKMNGSDAIDKWLEEQEDDGKRDGGIPIKSQLKLKHEKLKVLIENNIDGEGLAAKPIYNKPSNNVQPVKVEEGASLFKKRPVKKGITVMVENPDE